MSISRLICWIVIAITGAVALYAGVFFAKKQVQAEKAAGDAVVFTLSDYRGISYDQTEWADKVMLINFWATWCTPCREEMPMLADFQQRYSEKGLQVIGIALDDVEPVERFADTMDINYPLLMSDESTPELMNKYNDIGAIPFSLITDREGRVVETKLGVFTSDELEAMIEPLLE